MEENNKKVYIPKYIMEEIEEYIELTNRGRCKCMKWENIKALLRLAIVNNRITKEQATQIENIYCREK